MGRKEGEGDWSEVDNQSTRSSTCQYSRRRGGKSTCWNLVNVNNSGEADDRQVSLLLLLLLLVLLWLLLLLLLLLLSLLLLLLLTLLLLRDGQR